MKISQDTLNILKNFSGINKGIVLRKNKPLATVSEMENIYAVAEIQESFPCDIGIYDLSEFLGTLGLFQSPVLDFGQDGQSNFVVIKEEGGKSTVKYRFDDISLITSPSESYEIPSVEIEFDLTQTDIQKIQKACAIMGLKDIVIASTDGQSVSVIARDPVNKLSNFYELGTEANSGGHKFEFVINAENMKLISGDYNVKASKEGSVLFTNQKGNLSYLIALEESSTYS